MSYSDESKQRLLGVPRETLQKHGAVSAQAAVAMAVGVRERTGSSVGLAVTGIAGPGGGTPGKPVGLAYVAVADAAGHDAQRHTWQGDRSANKLESARAVLQLVLDRLGEGTR